MKYTVTIRTLGTAIDKLTATVRSVLNQTIVPEKVQIVMPFGYDIDLTSLLKGIYPPPPSTPCMSADCLKDNKDNANRSLIVVEHCEKGACHQRAFGISSCQSPYLLMLDDDMEIGQDFIQRSLQLMNDSSSQMLMPLVINMHDDSGAFNPIPLRGLRYKLLGVQWSSRRNGNLFTKVRRTGGYSMPVKYDEDTTYYAEGVPGNIMFGITECLKDIHFEDEGWVDEAGYSIPEDQILSYKMVLKGYRILFAPSLVARHLDSSATITGDKKKANVYSYSKNGLIFWHRFIYQQRDWKLLSLICIFQRLLFTSAAAAFKGFKTNDYTLLMTTVKGIKDGMRFLLSDEYRKLPAVRRN